MGINSQESALRFCFVCFWFPLITLQYIALNFASLKTEVCSWDSCLGKVPLARCPTATEDGKRLRSARLCPRLSWAFLAILTEDCTSEKGEVCPVALLPPKLDVCQVHHLCPQARDMHCQPLHPTPPLLHSSGNLPGPPTESCNRISFARFMAGNLWLSLATSITLYSR